MFSIAHADADGLGGADDLTVGIDQAELVDGFLDGDGIDLVRLVGNHASEGFLLGKFHSHDAKSHAEDAVEGGGCTATLEVAEGGGAGFLAGELLEAGGDLLADTAESDFAAAVGT